MIVKLHLFQDNFHKQGEVDADALPNILAWLMTKQWYFEWAGTQRKKI
jgi:hypothetical protein